MKYIFNSDGYISVPGVWLCWSARCSGNFRLQFWSLAVCKNI